MDTLIYFSFFEFLSVDNAEKGLKLLVIQVLGILLES